MKFRILVKNTKDSDDKFRSCLKPKKKIKKIKKEK